MAKTKTYKSEALAAAHEMAESLFKAGVIDKKTMRGFDETCLTPIEDFTPADIKALREREDVSQGVFAISLNVSKHSVSQWEAGVKHPGGPSLKLLSLVKKKGLRAIL